MRKTELRTAKDATIEEKAACFPWAFGSSIKTDGQKAPQAPHLQIPSKNLRVCRSRCHKSQLLLLAFNVLYDSASAGTSNFFSHPLRVGHIALLHPASHSTLLPAQLFPSNPHLQSPKKMYINVQASVNLTSAPLSIRGPLQGRWAAILLSPIGECSLPSRSTGSHAGRSKRAQ